MNAPQLKLTKKREEGVCTEKGLLLFHVCSQALFNFHILASWYEKRQNSREWAPTSRHIFYFSSNKNLFYEKEASTNIAPEEKKTATLPDFCSLKYVGGFMLSVCRFFFLLLLSTAYSTRQSDTTKNSMHVKYVYRSRSGRKWESVYRRRHETDAQRSQITNIISRIQSTVHKHQTRAKQHTSEAKSKSQLHGCELLCPDKIVPLVALSSQNAWCQCSQCSHTLESSSLAFVLCEYVCVQLCMGLGAIVYVYRLHSACTFWRSGTWTRLFFSSSFILNRNGMLYIPTAFVSQGK